jgi:hypothetical protein
VVSALDTNVLSALLSGKEKDTLKAQKLLSQAAKEGDLLISPIVYAELRAAPQGSEETLELFLKSLRIELHWQLDEAIWRQASTAYRAYAARRRKQKAGSPKRLLADFIIGAHALEQADRLITFDQGKYRAAFPGLVLLP